MTRAGRGQNRRQKREWPLASAPTCRLDQKGEKMYWACRWPMSALAKQKPLRIDKSPNAAIRDYLSDSKPRMHSFGTVWWSSCLRFKHCTMVPNSSCRHLADVDDDTLAKTWLHDVNTTPMKFSERTPNHLSGCPFRPVTPKKGCLWAVSSSLIFSRSRSVTSRLNREFSSWSSAIRSSAPCVRLGSLASGIATNGGRDPGALRHR